PERSTSSHSPTPTGRSPPPSSCASPAQSRSTASPPRSAPVGICRRSPIAPLSRPTTPAAILVPPTSIPTAAGSIRLFHRPIVSYPPTPIGATPQPREGNVKRRLGIGLALAIVALVAAGAGTSLAAKNATTLTIWSYDNQDPGLEPVLKQLSKEFE